jgi:hypothetical protein
MFQSARMRLALPLAVLLASSAGCGFHYHYSHAARPAARVSFYEVLSPYGEWFVLQPYGPVWRPHRHVVGVGFTPYVTGGRWVYTEHGWIFETDWAWGWAPFHYGRWLYLGVGEGWVWVPDTVWGPAWVEWRYGPGYVGWVPLPPPNVTVVVRVYEPRWYFVAVRHFPNGWHHKHVEIRMGPHEHPATAVIPPRHAPDGHAWYVGPAPDWVSREGAVEVRPKKYPRPAPLPAGAVEAPTGSRMRPLPPPGEPAGGWQRAPEPPHPERGGPRAGEGETPPPAAPAVRPPPPGRESTPPPPAAEPPKKPKKTTPPWERPSKRD